MDSWSEGTDIGVLFQEKDKRFAVYRGSFKTNYKESKRFEVIALTILETRVLAPGWLLGTENFEMLLPEESNNLTLLSPELTSIPTSNEPGIGITSFPDRV